MIIPPGRKSDTFTVSPARANLLRALRLVLGATKTEAFYRRALRSAVRELYRGGDAGEFVDTLAALIEEQFRRAWNEGARDAGFTGEMTDEDLLPLIERMAAEQEHMYAFADAIEKAGKDGAPIAPLYERADMWASRYNEIRDWARVHFGGKKRYKWVVGNTEHCEDCLALNGAVATGEAWEEARGRGVYPQSRDLECGGWRCQCELRPTDDPVTGEIPV